MSTPVTSPEAQLPQTNSLRSQWSDFFAFLQRPRLPEKAAGISGTSLAATFRILLLDFLLVGLLLTALLTAMALGLEIPETALAGMEITPGLIALVVLGAPLGEELMFRSWLSGRPGHILALLAVILGAMAIPVVAGATGATNPDDTGILLFAGIGLIVGLALAGLALWYLRNRGPWRWFAAIFPVILYLSALAFASVHLFNYEEDISPLLWLLVLPQFILGLVCAYVRVNFGLWSAILVHALHNGTIMGIVVAAEAAGMGT